MINRALHRKPKTEVNSGAQEGQPFLAPHVAPVVLIWLQAQW